MRVVIQKSQLGKIDYEESFWTGKKLILIDGKVLKKRSKNVYYLNDGESTNVYYLEGNYFTGVRIRSYGKFAQIIPASKWYEIALSVFIVLFTIIWGNSPSLVSIMPVVGGAIGGLISAAIALLNITLMRKQKNILVKLAIGIGMFIVNVALCSAVGALIVLLLAAVAA